MGDADKLSLRYVSTKLYAAWISLNLCDDPKKVRRMYNT